MRRRSHLRPPQPLRELQPTRYIDVMAPVLIFTSVATIVIVLGLLFTQGGNP